MVPWKQALPFQDSDDDLLTQACGFGCALYFLPHVSYANLAELELAPAHRERIASLSGPCRTLAQTSNSQYSWSLVRCHGVCRVRTLCGSQRVILTYQSVLQCPPEGTAPLIMGTFSWRIRFLRDVRHFFVFKQPHIWYMTMLRQGDVVMFRVDLCFVPPSCMETPQKPQDVAPHSNDAPEAVEGNKPLKVLRLDEISASIFERIVTTSGTPSTYHNVSFSRSYVGDDGKRKYSKSFSPGDLSKVVELAVQAHDYITDLAMKANKA